MREQDFLNLARQRIERAKSEEDCKTLSQFLIENYPPAVREEACAALGELSSEESVGELIETLFERTQNKETQAMIIQTLSEIMTSEELPLYTSSYDLQHDRAQRSIYKVLDYCLSM